jgi:hypothetical protein
VSDDIDKLEGATLNEAVAQEVMGWRNRGGYWVDAHNVVHFPSTNIQDAWLVVLHMQKDGRWYFRMDSVICGGWQVFMHDELACVMDATQPRFETFVSADAELPLAICRAALKAVRAPEPIAGSRFAKAEGK